MPPTGRCLGGLPPLHTEHTISRVRELSDDCNLGPRIFFQSGTPSVQWDRMWRTRVLEREIEGGLGLGVWPTKAADSARRAMLPICACFLLACVSVSVDLMVSGRFGLLAYPPLQDGLTYMAGAKSLFYTVSHGLREPAHLTTVGQNWALLHAPVWVVLMATGYVALGEGEWQSHMVRVWPVFLFLALVYWVVRRRWTSGAAWCAVALTVAMPVVLPALSACARGSSGIADVWTWTLGDLRPDFLAAVLVAWAVALLLENYESASTWGYIGSGLALGVACLTKPSVAPVLMITWTVAWFYFLILTRRRPAAAVRGGAVSLLACLAALGPYLAWGGFAHIKLYLFKQVAAHQHFFTVSRWPSAQYSALSPEFTYYGFWFMNHTGALGPLLVAGILIVFLIALSMRRPVDRMLPGYAAVAVCWYLLVSATPAKNPFLGLPSYVILWAASLGALAHGIRHSSSWRSAAVGGVAVCAVALWIPAQAVSFVVRHRDDPPPRVTAQKSVLKQVARDLSAHIKPGDFFIGGDWYNYSAKLSYYSIDGRGGQMYAEVWPIELGAEDIDDYITRRVATRAVAIVWKEDIARVSDIVGFWLALPESFEYYRVLNRWLNREGSPYRLVREYDLPFSAGQTLTLQMYARRSSQ